MPEVRLCQVFGGRLGQHLGFVPRQGQFHPSCFQVTLQQCMPASLQMICADTAASPSSSYVLQLNIRWQLLQGEGEPVGG